MSTAQFILTVWVVVAMAIAALIKHLSGIFSWRRLLFSLCWPLVIVVLIIVSLLMLGEDLETYE